MQSNANSTPQHIKRERFSPLKPILRFSFFSFLKSMIWKITNSTPATLKLHKTRGKNQKNYTEREREKGRRGKRDSSELHSKVLLHIMTLIRLMQVMRFFSDKSSWWEGLWQRKPLSIIHRPAHASQLTSKMPVPTQNHRTNA